MPIYEYKCGKCGDFEVTQRITEPALKRCPTCKGKVERLVSLTSFVLKGSGWYATDYARSGGDSKSDAAMGDTKTDTKANGTADSSSGAKSSSDSAAKTDDSVSSAKTSTPDVASKSSGKSKPSASKSAD